jgi:Flp pilus assembly protein TadG
MELAITTPILLFLLLGVMEAGRYVRAVVTVANAARNGASYASATTAAAGDQQAIRRAVLDEMVAFNTTDSNPNVVVQTKQDERNYSVVTVTVDYQFMPLMRFPGIPSQWQVNRAVQMRILS